MLGAQEQKNRRDLGNCESKETHFFFLEKFLYSIFFAVGFFTYSKHPIEKVLKKGMEERQIERKISVFPKIAFFFEID